MNNLKVGNIRKASVQKQTSLMSMKSSHLMLRF